MPIDRTRLRDEIVRLTALVAIAVTVFFATRRVAAYTRQVRTADAEAWYTRGEDALRQGDSAGAADDFRRAVAKNRAERRYTLALARALETSGNVDAAERALLALRESAPEDADINYELAQIAAARGDMGNAVRYYRNALYAPASAADAELRRRIRFQLVALLLADGDTSGALSELLVAATDTSPDAESAVRLGDLFAQAGDPRRAEEQYVRALRLAPDNVDAQAGAGRAAFDLGDYAQASRYLRDLPPEATEARALREVADLVLASDPLANRISTTERRRRLLGGIDAVTQRVADCVMRGAASDAVRGVAQQVDAFTMSLERRPDLDMITDGVTLIYEVQRAADESCGMGAPIDRAWLLIARRHGAER